MQAINLYITLKPLVNTTEDKTTKSGLELNSKAMDDYRYKRGVITSVGTNITDMKVGDEIIYDKHAGHSILTKEGEQKIIKYGDVALVD